MSVEPGSTFAGYRIERALGVGGMGSVYLAEHPRLPRLVALKLLRPELGADQRFVERFRRESTTVARLDHPNILPVLDRGSENGTLWMSMPFVAGTDADKALQQSPHGMPPARAVHIIGRVAAALDYAHRQQLLHRDVKPANILLAPGDDGEPERVFLTDFGIARSTADSRLTEAGAVIATFDYASPEQIEGRELDHRSDIYSLGCVLFALLTGAVPYPGASVAVPIHAHLHAPPPCATRLNPALSAEFDAVIATAMAKNPNERYGSGRALWQAADRALHSPPRTHPIPGDVDRRSVGTVLESALPSAGAADHTVALDTRRSGATGRGRRPWLIGGLVAAAVAIAATAGVLIWRSSAAPSGSAGSAATGLTSPVSAGPTSAASSGPSSPASVGPTSAGSAGSSSVARSSPARGQEAAPSAPAGPLPAVAGGFGEPPRLTFPSSGPPATLERQLLSTGSGPVVATGDRIEAHYLGQIWDGPVFDSSFDRGSTSTFDIGVGGVIAGWDAGLVGLPVGSRVLLSVPPDQAYGSAGNAGAGISGTDTLVFVVDIVGAG